MIIDILKDYRKEHLVCKTDKKIDKDDSSHKTDSLQKILDDVNQKIRHLSNRVENEFCVHGTFKYPPTEYTLNGYSLDKLFSHKFIGSKITSKFFKFLYKLFVRKAFSRRIIMRVGGFGGFDIKRSSFGREYCIPNEVCDLGKFYEPGFGDINHQDLQFIVNHWEEFEEYVINKASRKSMKNKLTADKISKGIKL